MLSIVTELVEGGLETRHFKVFFFSQKLAVQPHLKFSGFPWREK